MTNHLADLEQVAFELATAAGAMIVAALGQTLDVRYKALSQDRHAEFRDPVSDIDQAVEALLRERLAERFPGHGIIGEEVAETPATGSDVVWVIDPVDGTANFVNGFPLFSASIGVTIAGRPAVGAVWCSTSHALRPGVYHAREGGKLAFDGANIPVVDRSAIKRRIVGVPRAGEGAPLGYEARQTGSAAIECAFVAAGLMSGARLAAPNIWDVAGGLPLVLAAGGEVLTSAKDSDGWAPLETFSSAGGQATWRQPVILGDTLACSALATT